jgi:hypothetical protein
VLSNLLALRNKRRLKKLERIEEKNLERMKNVATSFTHYKLLKVDKFSRINLLESTLINQLKLR